MFVLLVDSLLWYVDYDIEQEVKTELADILGRLEDDFDACQAKCYKIIQNICARL
jgi:hypothetical protein